MVIFFVLFNCISLKSKNNEIKIGLFATLTGVYPHLGREIRDGALIAVEMINEEGGIKGKKVKLLIRDNMFSRERAIKNVEELISEEVIALIGPATSTMSLEILDVINKHKITTISPTASSSELTNRDDYLIRIRSSNKEDARVLAQYVTKLKIKKLAIIYDETNPVYCLDFIKNFTQNSSKDLLVYPYPNNPNKTKYKKLSQLVLSKNSDAVLIIHETFTASLIIQHLRALNKELKIIISPWSKSDRLLENAGSRAEGVITVDLFEDSPRDERFLKFKKRFFERFQYNPGFGATHGFEAVMVIKQAYELNPDSSKLKETILNKREFEGLQGKILFDRYGDPIRNPFIIKIENGKFVKAE